MTPRLLHLGALASLLLCAPARADDGPPEADDVPLLGRPAGLPFSGASGAFEVEARAEPTALRAEQPLTFTVTVRATGTVRRPPRRPDLRKLAAFADRFYVEDPDPRERRPDAKTWEFV